MQLLTITKTRAYDDAEVIMSNGEVTPNRATRQICYSSNNNPRRVYKCTDRGRPSECSSYQLLCKGDVILVGDRPTRRAEIKVYLMRYDGSSAKPIPTDVANNLLKEIPAEHVIWVTDIAFTEEQQAKFSHLPKGIGWDGVRSIQYRRKRRGVERILQDVPKALREDYIDRAMRSRHSNMQQSWAKALPMPKQMNAKLVHEGIPNVHEEAYVHWVLYHAKRGEGPMSKARTEYVRHCKQSLEWTSKHLGSQVNGKFGHSISMPDTVQWAIRIVVNPYTRGTGEPRGIAWTLFKR